MILRKFRFGVLFFVMGFLAASCAPAQPVQASDASFSHQQSFALAQIPKPTYTPTSIPIPTQTSIPSPLPSPTPTDTLAPAASSSELVVEIVADTPTPEYAAQVSSEAQPIDPGVDAVASYGGNKYILVDISEQHLYAYEGDALVYSYIASTGMNNSTRVGTFSVLTKIPNAYGATWNIWMPNWLGIYWSGNLQNGIHALPILPSGATLWSGYLGVPISYGCVVLDTYDAQTLYDWAEIGTPVEIQW